MKRDLYLDLAEKIGMKLCKTAYWDRNRCNWISKSVLSRANSSSIYSKALSPEVYDGTSGIALFLSNLYTNKNNDDIYATCEGAINQAISKVSELPFINRYGFYTGKLGVSYVAIQIGLAFHNQVLVEKGLDIFHEILHNSTENHLLDIISGNASGIPILLTLYKRFKSGEMLDLALKLGEELISSAIKNSIGWSWNGTANSANSTHNLTGFSHGAAGMGYSLLELFHATSEKKFLEGAKQAFFYENHWFNKQDNNWPDFRISGDRKKDSPYMIAWCHGAPGIGLSRIRAYELLQDKVYLRDCESSINKCIEFLEKTKDYRSDIDFSLCHGIAGISETLLYASQIFRNSSYKSIVEEVADYGIDMHESKNASWPCGIKLKGVGEIPGLMLGLAGIGNFYLRLAGSTKFVNPLINIPK